MLNGGAPLPGTLAGCGKKLSLEGMKQFIAVIAFLFLAPAAFSQDIKKMKITDLVQLIDTSSVPLVVNFWATWCQPCIREIPWFEKAVAEYKEKGVKLLLVSLDFADDYKNKSIHRFVKKTAYQSQVIWLDETNADKFCPPIDSAWGGSIPATLMVNNRKSYRQFFEHQIKEERFKLELKKLVD